MTKPITYSLWLGCLKTFCLLLMITCTPNALGQGVPPVVVTGNIPFAKGLSDGNKLSVWTMDQVRAHKDDTVNLTDPGATIEVKDLGSTEAKLGYASEEKEQKNFTGTLDLTQSNCIGFISILVDDMATLTIKETGGGGFDEEYHLKGSALWKEESYKEFEVPLLPGKKYDLTLAYKNRTNLTNQYGGKKDIDGVSIYISLLPVEFITPTGDPVLGPIDAGNDPASIPDGANEFTYSSDEDPAAAKLTMKVKVKIPGFGGLPAEEQGKYLFELDTIGNSQFAWDAANLAGKPTVTGDLLTATAIYTQLPLDNSGFGLKMARLKRDGTLVGEAKFEVFYPAFVSNFPRTSNSPNWFYYYKQNAGGGTYQFDIQDVLPDETGGGSDFGKGEGSIILGNSAVNGDNRYHTTEIADGLLKRIGSSDSLKYYASFIGVLEHEREHALRHRVKDLENTNPPDDVDGDYCFNDYESNTMNTRPDRAHTASLEWQDNEIYAGGPVEETAFEGADTSQDWANPGTNFGNPDE